MFAFSGKQDACISACSGASGEQDVCIFTAPRCVFQYAFKVFAGILACIFTVGWVSFLRVFGVVAVRIHACLCCSRFLGGEDACIFTCFGASGEQDLCILWCLRFGIRGLAG